MNDLRWMEACAVLALLLATACVEPLTNPPAELPPETLGEDGVPAVDTIEVCQDVPGVQWKML